MTINIQYHIQVQYLSIIITITFWFYEFSFI